MCHRQGYEIIQNAFFQPCLSFGPGKKSCSLSGHVQRIRITERIEKKIFFINRFVYFKYYTTFAAENTGVAQLVEHRSPKPGVGSSSLSSRAKKLYQIDTTFFISCKASTFPVPKLLKIRTFASHKKKLNSL